MSVSSLGLTSEQLEYYANRAGFFTISALQNTQRFLTKKNNLKAKIKLFIALENAGYDVTVSASSYDMLPPIPSTLPADSPLRQWLGDETWYCGL